MIFLAKDKQPYEPSFLVKDEHMVDIGKDPPQPLMQGDIIKPDGYALLQRRLISLKPNPLFSLEPLEDQPILLEARLT